MRVIRRSGYMFRKSELEDHNLEQQAMVEKSGYSAFKGTGYSAPLISKTIRALGNYNPKVRDFIYRCYADAEEVINPVTYSEFWADFHYFKKVK